MQRKKVHEYDIAAIGEALIDMTPLDVDGRITYVPNPGGAPLNLLAMAAKLGLTTAFIGKVGRDAFGEIIKESLLKEKIQDDGLLLTAEYNTTLAFVHLAASGDRSFSFYRKDSADVQLKEEEIPWNLIDESCVLHFGSLSLTQEPARSAVTSAVNYAKAQGNLISYDPNYRSLLWRSEKEAVSAMLSLIPLVDILKVSEEECRLLGGSKDLNLGAEALSSMGPKIVLVSEGEQGASYWYNGSSGTVKAKKIQAVDTTGCGDAFFGAFLARFIQSGLPLEKLTAQTIEEFLGFAVSAGTLTALNHGGIPSIPTEAAVKEFMTSSYQSEKE